MSYYVDSPEKMKPLGPRGKYKPNMREACGNQYDTQFRDPFDMSRFNKVDDAYRSKGPTNQSIMEQMGLIYPDIAQTFEPPTHKMSISPCIIMLSRKY